MKFELNDLIDNKLKNVKFITNLLPKGFYGIILPNYFLSGEINTLKRVHNVYMGYYESTHMLTLSISMEINIETNILQNKMCNSLTKEYSVF